MTEIVHSTPEDIAGMTDRAREVVRLNIEALEALERSIDVAIARACDIILSRPGYLVVTGMGKSGAYRRQDRRDPGLDRHQLLLRPPCGNEPWRPGDAAP